mmetsp:Transcript_228/g.457  ORF Transcript_228/g.457 Transcript_228/m.457 type:complete len:290 (-) Transcript_228:81-950(-)
MLYRQYTQDISPRNMSARNRERAPNTGRSNRDAMQESGIRSMNQPSARGMRDSVPERKYVNTARRTQLNDPSYVFRPYTPEEKDHHTYESYHPVLPAFMQEPTLPSHRTSRMGWRRPLACPEDWVRKLQAPHILDRSAFVQVIPEEEKQMLCRTFVERNRDRLWKMDSSSFNKTPRTVANEILLDPDFVPRMNNILNKERIFKLANSEKCALALTSSDREDHRTPYDPFGVSRSTPRDARKAKMEAILGPALLQHGHKHQRGHDHSIDFGNFSKYNAVKKANLETSMNR